MPTDAWGISNEYEDAFGKKRQVPQKTIELIYRAMGVEPERPPPKPRVKVIRRGEIAWKERGELKFEDGATITVDGSLPNDLPLGYHEFFADGAGAAGTPRRLIVTPGVCPLPSKRKSWGWAVQLYAARSQQSWGIGDLGDLKTLARWAKEQGAALLMINPLHAAAPFAGQEPSPYFPTTRRFRNPLYIRVEDVPGAQESGIDLEQLSQAGRDLNADRHIDRSAVFRLKMPALAQIFARFQGDARFDQYQQENGTALADFATFCTLAEQHGGDFRQWPARYRHPRNPEVAEFREGNADRVRFHAWLQWLVDEQLGEVSQELTVMQDLAVGFDRAGADGWAWQDALAMEMSLGCPPDLHNPWGQDWGLPPFIPHKLQQAGYQPFIETIRFALRHAGGLRIDHAMGLFRLFWIPLGAGAGDGAYVQYPARDLLGIVALEAHRAGAIVVGEDLGTVVESMRQELMAHNMLSYRLVWLEPDRPATYPERSMAAITTHDLFTVAGLWSGSDLRDQERIGLKPHHEAMKEVRDRVQKMTGLSDDTPMPEVVERMHQLLAEANSLVITATLEDALVVHERPNMPGTINEWPNWRTALPVPIEELMQDEVAQRVAATCDQREKAEVVSAQKVPPPKGAFGEAVVTQKAE